MNTPQRIFSVSFVVAFGAVGQLTGIPSASAECTNAGGVTVCAQGQVRGSAVAPDNLTGPWYPYPCEYDYYCNDGGADRILDVTRLTAISAGQVGQARGRTTACPAETKAEAVAVAAAGVGADSE